MIRVGIVDDEELVCRYLRRMLAGAGSGIEVVGHALEVAEAQALIARTAPDVVLLDVRLGRQDGLRLLTSTSAGVPAPRFLVLTGYPDDVSVLQALRDGATGFITKSIAPARLVSAIHLVADGHRVLGPGLPGLDPRSDEEGEQQRARVQGLLTDRELHVLRRLGAGQSNSEIATDLELTEGTVKGHVSALMVKLDCASRLQAGLLAQRLSL